jgi:hypothetical protein
MKKRNTDPHWSSAGERRESAQRRQGLGDEGDTEE